MFAPVEIVILRGVNQIESCHPANDSKPEDDGGNIDTSGLRDPCAQRRDCQRKSEKEVRRTGEPFSERIKKNHKQSNRREDERQAIDCRCRSDESGRSEYEPRK